MATIRTADQSDSDSLWMKGSGEGVRLRSLQSKRAETVKHQVTCMWNDRNIPQLRVSVSDMNVLNTTVH